MRNRGKRAALVLLLLGALLLLSGCVREDLSIVGVEPGQPGPESGQLRILFAMNIGNPPSPTMTIDDVSLSNVSFTITNEDTNEPTVVTNPTIDQDPAISYARFDEKGNMIEHQLGILIPYTLKPGHYRVTDVKGDVLYPSADGVVNRSLSVNTSYNTSFTIAAPPTPTTPTAHRRRLRRQRLRRLRRQRLRRLRRQRLRRLRRQRLRRLRRQQLDGHADSHACADPSARSENSDARKRGLHGKYGAGEPDSAYRRRHFRVRRGELQICIRGRQSA